MKSPRIFVALAALSVLGFANSQASAPAGAVWLETAFRFASAIDADPKDQAKAQELVVRDLVELGRIEEAIRRAGEIRGWRQGACFADLARELAAAGRPEEARELIARAEQVRRGVEGWQNPRIASHVAGALAALGDLESSRKISRDLAIHDAQQYAGQAVSLMATAHSARGDFDAAMDYLRKLEGRKDIYETWWRTMGYVAVARAEGLSRDQRLAALDAASDSADGIDAGARPAALEAIAEEYVARGERKRARKLLERAQESIETMGGSPSVQAAMLTGIARAWTSAGDTVRAGKLLGRAQPLVARSLEIERPGMYAAIAAVHLAAGKEDDARRLIDIALTEAEGLRNSRPRALALVTICRNLGRQGHGDDPAVLERIDSIFRGLGDPW